VAAVAASDGTYERSVVAALCAPAGLRAAPADDALAAFLAAAPTLSPEVVGACLVDEVGALSLLSLSLSLLF